jgi:hypothetical protein
MLPENTKKISESDPVLARMEISAVL